MQKTNIVLIPVDNRPVSYTLPEQIGCLNKAVKIFLPPREFLGNLKKSADIEKILAWIEEVVLKNKIDCMLVALDTIAYGGLIPSRKCKDSENTILDRIKKFKQAVKGVKIFAYSSIMRISNSNINEEEPEYWDKYGKLIFKYCHPERSEGSPRLNAFQWGDPSVASLSQDDIPPEILEDYLKKRQRNFKINKKYLEKDFDFLIFAKDDTAPFGVNVQEAEALEGAIKRRQNIVTQTGCDEMLLLLLTRTMVLGRDIKVFTVSSTPNGMEVIPRYEDLPLKESADNLLKTCGLSKAASQEEADLILLLHTPQKEQNDFALGEYPEKENEASVNFCVDFIETADKPVVLADVFAANGADCLLYLGENGFQIEESLNSLEQVKHLKTESQSNFQPNIIKKLPVDKLYGYAAWNTASNTMGTALAMGITRYIAEKEGVYSGENFKKLLFTRLADDWAYQSVARQKIRTISDEADEKLLHKEMIPLIKKIAQKFEVNPDEVKLSFPWDRTFEVEITIP